MWRVCVVEDGRYMVHGVYGVARAHGAGVHGIGVYGVGAHGVGVGAHGVGIYGVGEHGVGVLNLCHARMWMVFVYPVL